MSDGMTDTRSQAWERAGTTAAPPPKPNLAQRMHAIMQDVKYIQKQNRAGMRYSVVLHDDVVAAVRPAMIKHGVINFPVSVNRTQDGNRTEVDMTMRFVNIDDPNDYFDIDSCGYGIDNQDKGVGKALSYAKKYAFLLAFNLETGDDPDLVQGAEADHNDRHAASDSVVRMPIQANSCAIPDDPDDWMDLEAAIRDDVKHADSIESLTGTWNYFEAALDTMAERYSAQYASIIQVFKDRKSQLEGVTHE